MPNYFQQAIDTITEMIEGDALSKTSIDKLENVLSCLEEAAETYGIETE